MFGKGISNKALLVGCLAVPMIASACSDVDVSSEPELNTVQQGVAPNRYVVVLQPGANANAAAQRAASAHGGQVTAVWEHALQGFAIELSPAAAHALENNPNVRSVEPDIVMHKLVQDTPTGITRTHADQDPAAANAGGVTVGIIDTGIDGTHPDLNVIDHWDCAKGGPFGKPCQSGGTDGDGHGTHVAGTVAALDNDTGVIGVAPGAQLVGIRVLNNQGSGYMSWIINGVDKAVELDVDVANMSLGGQGYNEGLETAINNAVAAGITVTVAAGNSSADIDDANGDGVFDDPYTPASIRSAITVSALADGDGLPGGTALATSYGPDDSFATFSNYSSQGGIDLMLPGVDILSTVPGGGVDVYSGTSMASPHAAGLAALEIARAGRDRNDNGEFDGEDVQLILDALLAASKAQDSPEGLEVQNDPDSQLEPLGFAQSAPACTSDADCDDGKSCTADSCDTNTGECSNTPIDEDSDGYSLCDGDCDDSDPAINPGAAEVCGDSIDNDCSGTADDADEDGYTCDVDCDDTDPNVNPGEAEVCGDEKDNDCNDKVDDADNDLDGYMCANDCDDTDASINPDASEVCGDGTDNNCDGTVDEGCEVPACFPAGQGCTSDSDCCSNKCKGKPGDKSCK